MEKKKILSSKSVDYLARLSRMKLDENEKLNFTGELDKILDYVSQLSQLDTEGIEPTFNVLPSKNVFREDKVSEDWETGDILKNSPESKDGFFKVPRIIK